MDFTDSWRKRKSRWLSAGGCHHAAAGQQPCCQSCDSGLMKMIRVAFASLLLLSACASVPRDDAGRVMIAPATLDQAVTQVMQEYAVPGLALVVVRDGEIIYQTTRGERRINSGEAIDSQSLFKIASLSKAMTTAVLARLVDRGVLRWDDPVRKHLPNFAMHDPWVSANMQLRDLLIHNSGLAPFAGDLLLWPEPNGYDRTDILNALPYLKPIDSFRSRYRYDNVLYVVAGEVAAAATGTSFETLLQQEVFTPLGMSRCTVGDFTLSGMANVAQPHGRENGGTVPIRTDAEQVPISTGLAAGGIRCSLDDMARWLTVWLAPERAPDWLSSEQRRVLWSSHIAMPVSRWQQQWEAGHFHAYGYGWRLSDANGVWKVSHTGTLAGMYSAMAMLPDQRTGFVLMINGDGDNARTVLSQYLINAWTAPERASSVQDLLAAIAVADARQQVEKPLPQLVAEPLTESQQQTLQGRYREPWLGEVSICPTGAALILSVVKSPRLRGTVQQSEGRLFVRWLDASVGLAVWLQAADGGYRLQPIDTDAGLPHEYQDVLLSKIGACDEAS